MKYNRSNLANEGKTFAKDDFVFFWGHHEGKNGVGKSCFSQWYPCAFEVDGQQYNCAEQYMMAQKAKLFDDEEIYGQILLETDPKAIKRLGRLVKNYDDAVWSAKRFEVVVKGNMAKFSQNEALRKFLLGTGSRIIVEASPKDRLWGIGLDEFAKDAVDPTLWKGENLLGFALMEVRDRLNGTSAEIFE